MSASVPPMKEAKRGTVDREAVPETFRRWQRRTLIGMILGYAVYYFVRKNLSVAQPLLIDAYGFTNTQFGLILTIFSIVYGLGKFGNGILGDRIDSRYFMVTGLILSALVNVAFGLSGSLLFFTLWWALNAWFQSFGMPASIRLLNQWYDRRKLGTVWGLQSTAHQLGGAGVVLLAGFLVPHYGWQAALFVPAGLAGACSLVLWIMLRDNPGQVGLPPIEAMQTDEDAARPVVAASYTGSTRALVFEVLRNRQVWIAAIANIFIYIVRMGIMDWAPTFLTQARGTTMGKAALKTAAFELAGLLGVVTVGWASDAIFKGRRAPLGVACMLLLTASMLGIWWLPAGHQWLDTALLVIAGLSVYGPQLMAPMAANDAVPKYAASTAYGLVGLTGYLGSTIAGVGVGGIVDAWGWSGGFLFFAMSAAAGALCFLCLRAPRAESSV